MSSRILGLANTARRYAEMVEHRNFRHVSLILRNGQVIAVGTNETKSHPAAKRCGYRFEERHSELDALLRVRKDLRDKLTLVNFRFKKNGQMREASPCAKCQAWCYDAFVRIYASQSDGTIERLK